MVNGRYKCGFVQDKPSELYDLQTDPQEWFNLIGKDDSATLVADMKKRLDDWRARTPDAAERSDKTMKNKRKAKISAK